MLKSLANFLIILKYWSNSMIFIKRAYEAASKKDGIRILVDHLWPRGVSKEKAHLDLWLKDISPSIELREWFGHDPNKWQSFVKRYFDELDTKTDIIGHYPEQWEHFKSKYLKEYDKNPNIFYQLKKLAKSHHVTFVYAAHDTEHNNAVALKEYIEKK